MRPHARPVKELFMLLTWPRIFMMAAGGEFIVVAVDNFLDFIGGGTEVAALDAHEDVEGGIDVVVGDVGGGIAAGELAEVGEELGVAGGGGHVAGGNGGVFEIVDGIEIILGRLHEDIITDAVVGVEPEVGGGLVAGAEGDQEIAGDVAAG